MRYVFEKLAQDLFLAPYGWALWLFLLGFLLLNRGKVKQGTRAVAAGCLTLLFFSNNFVASLLGTPLERHYPIKRMADYPSAQAIVVLGGSVLGPVPPRLEIEELGGARVWGAARLYHEKKAPLILVTSGDPYFASDGSQRQEADDMRDLLISYGVPRTDILVEPGSRTTAENAVKSAVLLKEKGISELLLVTSAFHISRATRLFEKAGFKVISVPTSHTIVNQARAYDFFPKAAALAQSTLYLKEYFGRLLGR